MIWRFPLCVLLVLALSAQYAGAQDVVGFRLGFNVAGINGDVQETDDFGSLVGLAAGLFGTISLRHNFALQPELVYSQKGFTTGSASVSGPDGPGIPLTAEVELTYLEVPLLLKYVIPFGRSAAFSLYAGPVISYELSERITVDGLEGSQSSDQFRTAETGVAVGSDLETELFGVEGLIGVRYTRGLGNVLNEQSNTSPERQFYNQAVGVFIGLHLR